MTGLTVIVVFFFFNILTWGIPGLYIQILILSELRNKNMSMKRHFHSFI